MVFIFSNISIYSNILGGLSSLVFLYLHILQSSDYPLQSLSLEYSLVFLLVANRSCFLVYFIYGCLGYPIKVRDFAALYLTFLLFSVVFFLGDELMLCCIIILKSLPIIFFTNMKSYQQAHEPIIISQGGLECGMYRGKAASHSIIIFVIPSENYRG